MSNENLVVLRPKALTLRLTNTVTSTRQLQELQKIYLSSSLTQQRLKTLYPSKASLGVGSLALRMLDLQQLAVGFDLPYLAMRWPVQDAQSIIDVREALWSLKPSMPSIIRGDLLRKALTEQPVLLANILAVVPLDISSVLEVFNQPARLELFLSTLRHLRSYETHRRYVKDLLLFLSEQSYSRSEEEGNYLEMLETVVEECHLSHYLDYLVLIRTSFWLPAPHPQFQEHLQSILLLGGEAEIVTLDLEAYLSPFSIHRLLLDSREEVVYNDLLEQVQEPSALSAEELQSYLTELLQTPSKQGTRHPYRLFLEMLLRRVLVQRAVKQNYARLL